MVYSIKHINFATCSRNTPNSNTNKNYKKMATTIYNVVITNENGGNWPELIDNVIYTNLDEAKKHLKSWERKGVRDGEEYEDCFRPTFQYHHKYTNDKGQRVLEITQEHIVKVKGGQTIHSTKITLTEIIL